MIKTEEIEIILDHLLQEKMRCMDFGEFIYLLRLQREWEEKWLEVAEIEENESVLDWLDAL